MYADVFLDLKIYMFLRRSVHFYFLSVHLGVLPPNTKKLATLLQSRIIYHTYACARASEARRRRTVRILLFRSQNTCFICIHYKINAVHFDYLWHGAINNSKLRRRKNYSIEKVHVYPSERSERA